MTDTLTENAAPAEEAAKIVPRAEFRVFGRSVIDGVRENMWKCKAQLFKVRFMPEETYILSRFSDDANVKVRGGLLDVKLKIGETPEGYEIFRPQGKYRFPVGRGTLGDVFRRLGVEQDLARDAYTFDELCSLIRRNPDTALVSVEKMRYGFSLNGVICEYAKVWFNDAMVETACCESENYAAIRSAVEALGLEGRPNTNYLKAAKHVIGM